MNNTGADQSALMPSLISTYAASMSVLASNPACQMIGVK